MKPKTKTTTKKKQPHVVRMPQGKGDGIIEVDGIMYRPGKSKTYKKDGVKHIDYVEFESYDPESHNEIISQVAERLKDKVPPKRVVEELFKNTSTDKLKKVLKQLDSGEMEVKSTDGCLGLTFKNKKKKKSQYISIIN